MQRFMTRAAAATLAISCGVSALSGSMSPRNPAHAYDVSFPVSGRLRVDMAVGAALGRKPPGPACHFRELTDDELADAKKQNEGVPVETDTEEGKLRILICDGKELGMRWIALPLPERGDAKTYDLIDLRLTSYAQLNFPAVAARFNPDPTSGADPLVSLPLVWSQPSTVYEGKQSSASAFGNYVRTWIVPEYQTLRTSHGDFARCEYEGRPWRSGDRASDPALCSITLSRAGRMTATVTTYWGVYYSYQGGPARTDGVFPRSETYTFNVAERRVVNTND